MPNPRGSPLTISPFPHRLFPPQGISPQEDTIVVLIDPSDTGPARYLALHPNSTLQSCITIQRDTMENSHTPALVSPPTTRTPPAAVRKSHVNGHANGADRAGSEPVDPSALSKALKNFEEAGHTRERTPGASPSRKRQRIYGDRSVLDTYRNST